jgi:hypothetical protein
MYGTSAEAEAPRRAPDTPREVHNSQLANK